MSPTRNMPVWLERGHVQSLLVLAFSVAFNASRWFELRFDGSILLMVASSGQPKGFWLKPKERKTDIAERASFCQKWSFWQKKSHFCEFLHSNIAEIHALSFITAKVK